jgi:hypothetical protein
MINNSSDKKKIDSQVLHLSSQIGLTLTTLPWKRNRLFFGRALMAADYTSKVVYALREHMDL